MALAGDPEPPTEESAYVDGPVTGIDCTGESGRSLSTSGGILPVQHGERVTLSLGQLVLGTGATTASMTSIDLDPTGTPLRAGNRAVNVARLLQSLGTDPHLVAGITVTEAHRDAASQFAGRIDFDLHPDAFGYDPSVRELLGALGVELRDEHPARNHLRRSAHSIKKRGDVPVPLRDGSALLADVFVPSDGRPVPAVLRLGPYGRAFGFGPLITEADRRHSERRETAWFEDHSSGAGAAAYGENLTSVDAFTWVPRGYAVVRVDERGTGGTRGPLQPFSRQEAIDYYDVIEWVAAQDWCTGAVGLAAASYGATIQWNVARLRPPSLRAMIPWATDIDSYRELAYPGASSTRATETGGGPRSHQTSRLARSRRTSSRCCVSTPCTTNASTVATATARSPPSSTRSTCRFLLQSAKTQRCTHAAVLRRSANARLPTSDFSSLTRITIRSSSSGASTTSLPSSTGG